MLREKHLIKGKKWVIKIGSALLTNDGQGLNTASIHKWVNQLVELIEKGHQIILVSSGAVAEGMSRLGWNTRPIHLHQLQAAAAIGQSGLIQSWESAFQVYNMKTAQVLLTHADLSSRQRYLNARSTLMELLKLNIIPIINENDTVVTDEIRFGDNDSLAALVANLVEADGLVLLTDQKGLFDSDPRENPNAKLISSASANDPSLLLVAGEGGSLGRGGMITKVKAAATAARSGAFTIIAHGSAPSIITKVIAGEDLGTFLHADQPPIVAKKQWIGSHLQVKGRLYLDDGAVEALQSKGKSLLPIGVNKIEGNFNRGEVVECLNQSGESISKGLVNYNYKEVLKIIGKPSDQIPTILGYSENDELIHRDNMILNDFSN